MKVLGIAGYSGSGKTTLIEKVVPILVHAGLRVSLIKHAHHQFEVDQPGKDSYRHRHAGCTEVLVSSTRRWALMHELRGDPEPALAELVRHFSPCDLVLVEGYKHDPIPRIEVHRAGGDRPLLFPRDPHVIALATDEPLETRLPQFGLDDAPAVARFILDFAAGREGRARLAAVPPWRE
jgi:molybdopterin-guanine dinucleotide biosynthesis adapter protein